MNVYIDRSGSTFNCDFEEWAYARIQEIAGDVTLFGFSSQDVWHINKSDDWTKGNGGTLVQAVYDHAGRQPSIVLTDTPEVWVDSGCSRPASTTVLARGSAWGAK